MCCVSSCTAGISFRGMWPVPPSLQHRRQQNTEAAISQGPPTPPPPPTAPRPRRHHPPTPLLRLPPPPEGRRASGWSAEAGTATPQAGRAQRRLRRSQLGRKIRRTGWRGGAEPGGGASGEARRSACRTGGGWREPARRRLFLSGRPVCVPILTAARACLVSTEAQGSSGAVFLKLCPALRRYL